MNVSNPSIEHTDRIGTDSTQPAHWTTLDRVLVVIVALALAGNCLLISAGRGTEVGHRPWAPDSALRILTELLNFNYAFPTPSGVGVKWLAQGFGAAAVLFAIAVLGRPRRPSTADKAEPDTEASHEPESRTSLRASAPMAPATAAQILLLAFAVWSMASATWAGWPGPAAGEGFRLLSLVLWAVVLGRGLGRSGARAAAVALVSVLTATALLGIWYHTERNPFQRLKFPIGNPLFLAACLIPGITVCLAVLVGGVAARFSRSRRESAVSSKTSEAQVFGTAGDATSRTASSGRGFHPGWLAGGLVGLAILLWAFWLTGSRGPTLGLLVGIVFGAYVAASAVASRQLRWVSLGVLAIMLIVGGLWLREQLSDDRGGRAATVRVRMIAWQHAFEMFLEQPLVGHGQGSYTLQATQRSRADAIADPAAFPGHHLAHAHNEWLEIMADLGAAGIALVSCGLVFTLIAAWRSLGGGGSVFDRWLILGLLAALLAIVVEEAADVALRKAGLPLVFYTVIGLIWALARREHSGDEPDRPAMKDTGRYALVIGGSVAAIAVAAIHYRNWEGALAAGKVSQNVEKAQWDEAIAYAKLASDGQLAAEDRVFAYSQQVWAAYLGARRQVQRVQEMMSRLDADRPVPPRILQLAAEDAARFERYFETCQSSGETLYARMPMYHAVAGRMSRAWLLRQSMEQALYRLGLRQEAPGMYLEQARKWMHLEYQRDPYDAADALQLFALLPDGAPLASRVEVIRIPLRLLSRHDESYASLVAAAQSVSQQPGFAPVMNDLMSAASATLADPEDQPWPDPYAPETLRLGAIIRAMDNPAEAAVMVESAADLLSVVSLRFPTAESLARLDQANYLFLADPDRPEAAVAACREAINAWPRAREREAQLENLRQDLVLYLLADGDESAATEVMRDIRPELADDKVRLSHAEAYATLCRLFLSRAPAERPERFTTWLNRALELNPDSSIGLQIALHVALEQEDDEQALAYLRKLDAMTPDRQQMLTYIRALADRFPDNPTLQRLLAPMTQPATQPSERPRPAPATPPATRDPFMPPFD